MTATGGEERGSTMMDDDDPALAALAAKPEFEAGFRMAGDREANKKRAQAHRELRRQKEVLDEATPTPKPRKARRQARSAAGT